MTMEERAEAHKKARESNCKLRIEINEKVKIRIRV
jgi:hypothetical protein